MITAEEWAKVVDHNWVDLQRLSLIVDVVKSIQQDAIQHAATLHMDTTPSEHYEHQRELERIIESLTL